jgi:cytochrome c oxidase cbb3-type subunit III
MSENKEKPMSGHDYDGITELDNNLPQWWVWLFVLTCVWALGYMLYYHVMGGPGQIDEYKAEMAAAGKPVMEVAAVAGDKPATAEPPPAAPAVTYSDEASNDETLLAMGEQVYIKNCLVCHAPDGGGLIGPNLCDDSFIHGPTYADSIHVILKGVPAKGMIPWEGVLNPDEVHAVASYIWAMRGTTPANPKPPEGTRSAL